MKSGPGGRGQQRLHLGCPAAPGTVQMLGVGAGELGGPHSPSLRGPGVLGHCQRLERDSPGSRSGPVTLRDDLVSLGSVSPASKQERPGLGLPRVKAGWRCEHLPDSIAHCGLAALPFPPAATYFSFRAPVTRTSGGISQCCTNCGDAPGHQCTPFSPKAS